MYREIFVSPLGDDCAKGSIDAPFRTLKRALKDIQPETHIFLRDGTYHIGQTISVSDVSDVTIEAYQGETVILTGARQIRYDDFMPIQNAQIRQMLPSNALELDLKKIEDLRYGQLMARGFRRPYIPSPMELIVDGEAMHLSRYPKDRDYPIKEVIDPGSVSMDVDEPDFSNRGGTIRYDDQRISTWKHWEDVQAAGFFAYGFSDDTVPVASVDTDRQTVTLREAVMFGIKNLSCSRYHFLNVLDEMCCPGEYYIDRCNEKLYFIPAESFQEGSTIYLTEMEAPLISLINTKRVVIRKLTLAASRGIGVYMDQGEKNILEDLQIQNMGIVGIVVGKGITPDREYRHHYYLGTPVSGELGSLNEHFYNDILFNRDAGTGHRIRNCVISDCGAGGISMGGGDRRTLTPAGNCIEHCCISNCNRLDKSLKALINLDGVGNVIRGCELYEATNMAIMLHGNEHLIEYNNIHHTCTDTEDAGAIYLGRDPSEQGNVIRFNYIHDIMAAHRPHVPLKDGLGSFGVYNDDNACGTVIYGNVFFRAGTWAIHNNCCSDIKIENNLFVECQAAAVHGDRFWGILDTDPMSCKGGLFYDRLYRQARIQESPYRDRYPNLLKFYDNDGKPSRNVFSNNIMYRCLNGLATRHKDEWYINDYYLTKENVSYQDVIANYRGWYKQQGNYMMDEDPIMDGNPFNLLAFQREDILACIPGFERIPVEKIAGVGK